MSSTSCFVSAMPLVLASLPWRRKRKRRRSCPSGAARSGSPTRASPTSRRGRSSPSSTSSATTSRSRRGRCAGIRDRPHRAQALRRRGRGAGLLPEARAREAAALAAHGHARRFRPGAPPRRWSSTTPPASRGSSTSAASSCTRTRCGRATSSIPTSCASISIPARASAWEDVRRVALEVRSAARGAGAARMAQDERLARHARQRAHRAAVDVHRGAPRGAGAVARDRAARARRGDVEVVEGGAPRRLPRLQPERQGSDHVLGVLRAAAAGRARVGAARAGTRCRTATRRLHRADDAGALRGASAIRTQGMDAAAGLARGAAGARRRATRRRGWATRPGRRTSARWRARRRAWRRRARGASRRRRSAPPRNEDAARRRGQLAGQGGGAGRARAMEGSGIRRRRRCWRWTTCSSTRCAGGRRRGRGSA